MSRSYPFQEKETGHEDIYETLETLSKTVLALNKKQEESGETTRRENEDVLTMILDLNGKILILQQEIEKLERTR